MVTNEWKRFRIKAGCFTKTFDDYDQAYIHFKGTWKALQEIKRPFTLSVSLWDGNKEIDRRTVTPQIIEEGGN